jgi:molybdopterin-containing oxidoreductase family iron-sulfur binding subunit
MKKYAMVIDMHKCVGCGACNFGCKIENNVGDDLTWAKVETLTKGTFPKVTFEHITTLCNHCNNAPCVKACPTKAMHKIADGGLTLHNPAKCIGCQSCVIACPYGMISFNKVSPLKKWESSSSIIPKCTSSGKEVAEKAGEKMPFYNPDRAKTYEGIRGRGVVEKCTFCDHRIAEKKDPYCVEVCPAKARIFGDISDPKSEVSKLVSQHKGRTLKPEQGTEPSVYYIRNYKA